MTSQPGEQNPDLMSADDIKVYHEISKDLTPSKMLARLDEYNKAVVSTVTTVGTLLAGLGGITAVVAINRDTTYWRGIPVVPSVVLLTSVLAGLAVAVALFGRQPKFTPINRNNLVHVKHWHMGEVARKKGPVKYASLLLLASACTAVIAALLAGLFTIVDAQTEPRNLASLSSTVGDKGAVTVHLGGAIDGLDQDQPVTVKMAATQPTGGPDLVEATIYPDADGKVALGSDLIASPGTTEATATLTYAVGENGPERDPWKFTVNYPEVPAPAQPAGDGAEIAAATPATVALLAGHLSSHGGHVPGFIAKGLKVIDLAGWIKNQQELLSHGQLSDKQKDRLEVVSDWRQSQRQAARFAKGAGILFVWGEGHKTMPAPETTASGFALGAWVEKQRERYAQGDLTASQVALLEAVPGWTWKAPST